MTRIRELIDIPTQVRDGDFVLKLTEDVGDDAAAATIASYEVTPQLAHAFDEALVGSALSTVKCLPMHGFSAGKPAHGLGNREGDAGHHLPRRIDDRVVSGGTVPERKSGPQFGECAMHGSENRRSYKP